MRWEELTSKTFVEARELTKGTCVIPFGVIEKHGLHMPLGTDVLVARKIAEEAAKIEPVVIFPFYFFGQIAEARHVPGTISYSPELQYKALEETCGEIARNGFKKIILLNGHGGNNAFISCFLQNTLYREKDYAVYSVSAFDPQDEYDQIRRALKTDDFGGHAGNFETSVVMGIDPDLVRMDSVETEGMRDYGRLSDFQGIGTAIGWYAAHPTHFDGDPSLANAQAGREIIRIISDRTAKYFRLIKNDDRVASMQDDFFHGVVYPNRKHPDPSGN